MSLTAVSNAYSTFFLKFKDFFYVIFVSIFGYKGYVARRDDGLHFSILPQRIPQQQHTNNESNNKCQSVHFVNR